MIEEAFAVGDSCIHRLNPQFRIVWGALFATVIAVSYQLSTLIMGVAIAVVCVCCARLPWTAVFKKLTVIWGFLFLLWLIIPVTMPGKALLTLGPFSWSREGLMLALGITLKANAILMLFTALVATMSLSVLGYGLEKLGAPAKLVHLLLLTYRYIFVIEHEYRKLRRAAAIRGFRPRTNMHTYKTYAFLIGMLFVRAAERAQRVHQAMCCRGFRGRFYCLRDFTTTPRDWVGSVLMALGVGLLVLLEWGGAPWK